ncbi:hypothetical protein [Methanocrinis sp.]|uniref:hypothetical protein n=1 Tax=Methanocrinis sp. TaxID=3101522 RepID=UPI003D0FF495
MALPALLGDTTTVDDDSGEVHAVLSAEEYSIIKDEASFEVIMMDGFASTTSSGDPMLMHKV